MPRVWRKNIHHPNGNRTCLRDFFFRLRPNGRMSSNNIHNTDCSDINAFGRFQSVPFVSSRKRTRTRGRNRCFRVVFSFASYSDADVVIVLIVISNSGQTEPSGDDRNKRLHLSPLVVRLPRPQSNFLEYHGE